MLSFGNCAAVILAYLLGSVPSAVWIGRYFYGVDVRHHGSGNAGATNTFRVLGKTAGIPVLLLDVLKGWLAVTSAHLFSTFHPGSDYFINFQFVLGLCAVIGHIFPAFANFRGGKGIATLLGAILAVHYQAALVSMAVFLLVFLLTHYVSLSSIVGAFMFPLSFMLWFHLPNKTFFFYSLAVWLLVLITHQKNIERLLNREESKIYLVKKGKKKEKGS